MQTSSPQRLGEGNESRAGVLRVRAANNPSVITITEKAPIPVQHSVMNVKALLGTFNQEKTFSKKALFVIIKTDGSFASLVVRAEG